MLFATIHRHLLTRFLILCAFLSAGFCQTLKAVSSGFVTVEGVLFPVTETSNMFTHSDSTGLKKTGTAVLLSAGSTIVLAPVAGIGLIVGPSAGSIYAEDWQAVRWGVGIRTASIGVIAGSALAYDGSLLFDTYMAAFGSILLGSIVYDTFFMSRKSVRKYNDQLQSAGRGLQLTVRPWAGAQRVSPGISLHIRFN